MLFEGYVVIKNYLELYVIFYGNEIYGFIEIEWCVLKVFCLIIC